MKNLKLQLTKDLFMKLRILRTKESRYEIITANLYEMHLPREIVHLSTL